MLTACPSCLQGLARYEGDTGAQADYIVVELARHLLGEDWMQRYVGTRQRGRYRARAGLRERAGPGRADALAWFAGSIAMRACLDQRGEGSCTRHSI